VLSWRQRWYVAGLDRDRGEPRSFRLSRIVDGVEVFGRPGEFTRPPHVDLLALVTGREPETERTATIRVTGPAASRLRQIAESESEGVLTIGFTDVRWLATRVASAGSSAVVHDPPDLVDAVVEQLRQTAGTLDRAGSE
jgi:proteasome accessory factor B